MLHNIRITMTTYNAARICNRILFFTTQEDVSTSALRTFQRVIFIILWTQTAKIKSYLIQRVWSEGHTAGLTSKTQNIDGIRWVDWIFLRRWVMCQEEVLYENGVLRSDGRKRLSLTAPPNFTITAADRGKVQLTLEQTTKPQGAGGGVEVYIYSFFKLATRWCGWSRPRSGRLTPGKDLVPIVKDVCRKSRPHRDSIPGSSSP
jgi:hypothetical protein